MDPPASPVAQRAPAVSVLCDQWLLQHVASFQRGLPHVLVAFWRDHAPETDLQRVRSMDISTMLTLADTLVEHGSLRLLEVFKRTAFPRDDGTPFRAVVRSSITFNKPEYLEWVFDNASHFVTKDRRYDDWWMCALASYQAGDLAVLNLCKALFPRDGTAFHPSCLELVDATLLPWVRENLPGLFKQLPSYYRIKELVHGMVGRGDLAAVQCAVEYLSRDVINQRTITLACDANQFHIVEYLVEQFPEKLQDPDTQYWGLQSMVDSERRKMQAIITKHVESFRPGIDIIVQRTVDGSDYVRLEWLEKWSRNGWFAKIAPFAIDKLPTNANALQVLRFLEEKRLATATTDAMDLAAECGAWEVVDYLHEHRSEGCTQRAIDAAVKCGSLERVRFFFESYQLSCSSEAVTLAAQDQPIEILHYLHENTPQAFTVDAMDAAAGRGRLDVVEFLHEHRSEGCTTEAIGKAAEAGHFNVVKFLIENRVEGCTDSVVSRALENGHVEVARLLFDHYPDLFGPSLLYDSLLRGAFDVFEILSQQYPDQVNNAVERAIFAAGEEVELLTIQYILETLGRNDLAHRAVDGAAGGTSLDWFQKVIAVAGPGSCQLSAVCSAVAGQSRRSEVDRFVFVSCAIQACNDPAARACAIQTASADRTVHGSWLTELEARDPASIVAIPDLHPLLRDSRTSAWAAKIICNQSQKDSDRIMHSQSWPVHAISRRDLTMLQVIRELALNDPSFAFDGARAAAIRAGDLRILQWLVENVTDIPLERDLLGEAVYYHRYDIAEWLVGHHPNACTELDWTHKGHEIDSTALGLRDGLLNWLASHDAVRNALRFVGIVDFAAKKNDVASLRQLYEWYPELFVPRPRLNEVIKRLQKRGTIEFWTEIGWFTLRSSDVPPLHPFLQDPRTSAWVHETIAASSQRDRLSAIQLGCNMSLTWVIRAIQQRDINVLEVIRDLPARVHEPYSALSDPFSFAGAHLAAVRVGDLAILQWLFANVKETPAEPSLLGEAVYYHRYDIAEWLVAHHLEACTELNWTIKQTDPSVPDRGLCDKMFDWLESCDSVRQALPFKGIVDFAARKNDVASLERLYEWHPELFTPRWELTQLADLEECSATINFLLEIGWDPEVFFE